jgi:hypothetical protein
MDRFTQINGAGEYFIEDYYGRHYGNEITKLGKIEDIGEQVGCPLEVREQAFDEGFYDQEGNHHFCEHYVPYLKSMHTRGSMTCTEKHFKLKDYKKTWWLKKDKSE